MIFPECRYPGCEADATERIRFDYGEDWFVCKDHEDGISIIEMSIYEQDQFLARLDDECKNLNQYKWRWAQ